MPQQRKLATVLFADIVGSSDVTGSHDPEVVRQRLADAFAAMRRVLVQHGGTVEKFIGDAVMAVFGVPTAHDDDAERAVRAALALPAAIRGVEGGDELGLRIGINTGEVVSGDEETAETLVTGTPVITAARLQAAAAPGEILVGALTRRLTEGRMRYGPDRTIAAKNLGRIVASPVGSQVVPRSAVADRGSEFVGRDAELARLRAAHDAATRTGRVVRVLVTGAAGIGKTRVAERFAQERPDDLILWGRCLAYGEGIALWPIQEIVRAVAGITAADTADDARAKLESTIGTAVGPVDGPSVVGRLAALVSGGAWPTDASPPAAQRELADAIARALEATDRSSAITLIIEDLHAAEPALLETIAEVCARARAPVLLLGLARPDVIGPGDVWANEERIELGPLPPTDAERLARSLVGARASPDSLLAILGRAEGNPLYIEEIAETVLEVGDPEAVPPTLRGLISARIDRAGADVRHLLQRASALGRDFWLDAIPLDPGMGAIAEPVAEAERRGLVMRLDAPGPSGEPTMRFRHALIRDVVYASTTKGERSRLHAHYASWFTSVAAEAGHELTETIAFHAQRSFELAREIEHAGAAELGQRAFDALMRATQAAQGRADFRAALALSRRALEIGERSGLRSADAAASLATHAMVRLRLEPSHAAVELLDRAIGTAREVHLGEQLVHLLTWRAGIALAEDVALSRALLAEAVTVAKATGDGELIAYAVSRSGMVGEMTGALDDQARWLTEARDLAVSTGARGWLPDTLADLSANALHQGDVRAAHAHAQEAWRLATTEGTRLQRFKATIALAASLLAEGDTEQALAEANTALVLAGEVGGPWALALGSEAVAEALLAREDPRAARGVLADAAEHLDPDATPAMRGHVARIRALLARVLVRVGELEEARRSAAGAADAAPPSDPRATACALWALGDVAAADGRGDDALARLAEALGAIGATGYRDLAARIRSRYAALVVQLGKSPDGIASAART